MASGLAIGTVMLLDPLAELEMVPDRPARDIAAEESRFKSAVVAVQEELRDGAMRMAADVPGEVRALFEAHAMLLGSDDLVLAKTRPGRVQSPSSSDLVRH
jgi:phosphotransferase system enzyme I (PtsP)